MKPDKIDDIEMDQMLNTIEAGLNRFFSEGYTRWSKENFLKMFNANVNLNDFRIQLFLYKLEQKGIIKIIGRDDVFIEIIKESK